MGCFLIWKRFEKYNCASLYTPRAQKEGKAALPTTNDILIGNKREKSIIIEYARFVGYRPLHPLSFSCILSFFFPIGGIASRFEEITYKGIAPKKPLFQTGGSLRSRKLYLQWGLLRSSSRFLTGNDPEEAIRWRITSQFKAIAYRWSSKKIIL